MVKKKSDGITRDILTSSQAVIAIENEMASSDALFLQVSGFSVSDVLPTLTVLTTPFVLLSGIYQHEGKVKHVLHYGVCVFSLMVIVLCCLLPRAQIPQNDPEKLEKGLLINVARHVSSLKYHVWEKMVELVHYSKPLSFPPSLCEQFILICIVFWS